MDQTSVTSISGLVILNTFASSRGTLGVRSSSPSEVVVTLYRLVVLSPRSSVRFTRVSPSRVIRRTMRRNGSSSDLAHASSTKSPYQRTTHTTSGVHVRRGAITGRREADYTPLDPAARSPVGGDLR